MTVVTNFALLIGNAIIPIDTVDFKHVARIGFKAILL